MSGGGGGGSRGKGAAAAATPPIPAGSVKLVQTVKEVVVDFPESEIYAMLRECNMDPYQAIDRLLTQDTFHEVKSKKDKKKEIKEPPESRSRVVNNSLGRGPRVGADRGGRNTASQFSSNDYGISRGKPVNKKENGSGAVPTSSILESPMTANNPSRRPTALSNSASMENRMHSVTLADEISVPLQPSPGFQNNWLGKPGVSMADIVKMGRPQGKLTSMPVMASDRSYMSQNTAMPNIPCHVAKKSPTTIQGSGLDKNADFLQESSSQVAGVVYELGIADGQHTSHDGWSLVDEQSTRTGSIMLEKSDVSAVYGDPLPLKSSNLVVDGVNSHVNPHSEEAIQVADEILGAKSLPAESRSSNVSDRHIQVDTSEDDSHFNDGLLQSASSNQSQIPAFEHSEGSFSVEDASVSSATTSMLHLSLHEETSKKSVDANPAVIIPDHLQVTNADCAHLSFGSFESGTFAGSFSSKPLKSNLEVAPVADAAAPIEHSDTRNECYNNGQLTSTLTGNIASRTDASVENLDLPSSSQPEAMKNDTLIAAPDLQYNLPSVSNYAFSSTTQPITASYFYPQGNMQMQNLSPFSSLMQPNALQSSSLTPSISPLRDFDLSFSPLLTNQALPTKYNAAGSSVNGPSSSVQETLKTAVFAQSQQTVPSTVNTTAAALPQHLPVHPYPQPALPLGHFANMISYPFLPQSYTYLPSAAFQQAYSGNSPFHQSPAALPSAGMKYSLPQYKSGASTSLPQSSALGSAYGGFGNSTIAPGSFASNVGTVSSSTSMGFDEALQYKEGNHYMPLQQTENPAMWLGAGSSRTMSVLPASTFYSYQGQSQHSGLRHSQQSSQFGTLGYQNFYHSPAGASQEHQQNHGEGNLNGSQTAQTQPAHQIWQHSY